MELKDVLICPIMSKIVTEDNINQYGGKKTAHYLKKEECFKEKCALWAKEYYIPSPDEYPTQTHHVEGHCGLIK